MSPLDDIHANRTGKPKMSRRQKWLACAFLLAMLGAVVPVMVNGASSTPPLIVASHRAIEFDASNDSRVCAGPPTSTSPV